METIRIEGRGGKILIKKTKQEDGCWLCNQLHQPWERAAIVSIYG